jgi:nucleosome binding factor SPN SPT16 subunit
MLHCAGGVRRQQQQRDIDEQEEEEEEEEEKRRAATDKTYGARRSKRTKAAHSPTLLLQYCAEVQRF